MSNGSSTATPGAVKPGGSDILGVGTLDPNTAMLVGESNPNQQARALYGRPLEPSTTRYGTVPKSYERILGEGNYHPEFGPEYNASLLAREQSGMRQFGSFLNQGIVGEIVGGTIEGIGYLTDLAQYGELAKGSEQEFGNALSEVGKSIKEWTREATPVYVDPNQRDFAPGRLSWWMSNGSSIFSTLGLLIPAAGAVKGISALGKAAKIGFGGKAFLKTVDNIAAKYGEKAARKFASGSELFATGVGQAVASRHMENLMEASQVFQEIIDEGGTKQEAALAATNTYNKQWLLLLQDIPQYILFNKLRGGKGAAEKSKEISAFLGYNTNKYFVNKPVSVMKTMLGEAFEEGYQYVINEQSKLMAETAHDPAIKHSFGDVLNQNIDDGELYTSMFFGAMGAGVMLGAGHLTQHKKMAAANEARLDDLKNNGKRLNVAYQAYSEALASGDPIRLEQATNNLSLAVGMSAVLHDNVGNAVEMIEQLGKSDNTAAAQKFGIEDLAAGELQQSPEKAEQIITDIKHIENLYDRFKREVQKNKKLSDKQRASVAVLLTENQFLQEKTQEQKDKSDQRLTELEGQLQGLDKLSSVARHTEILKNSLAGYEGHTYIDENNEEVRVPGLVKYYEDRLANKKQKGEKRAVLGKEEKARLENRLAEMNLERERIKSVIKELEADPAYTKAMKINDTKVRRSLDDRVLNAYVREQRRNIIAEESLKELEEDAEKYRDAHQFSSSEEREEAESQKKEDRFDPDTDIAIDDLVGFVDDNETPIRGFVDDIELATEENGVAVEPSGNNGNNTYTLNLVDEAGNLTGEQVRVMGSLLEILDKRELFGEETTASDLTEQQEVRAGLYNIREASETEQNGAPTPIDDLSYSNRDSQNPRLIEIRNEALNRVLSNSKTDLSNARASYFFDHKDTWTNEYLRGKNDAGKALYARLDAKQKLLLGKLAKGTPLTQAEIGDILKTTSGDAFADVVDNLRILVEVQIGKKKYTTGLTLHGSSFPYMSVPARVQAEEKKKPGAIAKYKQEKMFEARKIRTFIIRSILEGRTPFTEGLEVGRGHPITVPGTTNNVSDILQQKPNDVLLGIAQPKINNPYDAKLMIGADNSHSIKNYSSAGAVYAITEATINGEPYALKLNKTHITNEHAAIIYEAFRLQGLVTLDDRKKKKRAKDKDFTRNIQFKQDDPTYQVKGLSTAELLDLLILHGEKLTEKDINRRNYSKAHRQILANKRLWLDLDFKTKTPWLVYGNNPLTNQPNRINLRKASVSQINDFYKWVTENKTYAVHLNNRVMSQELNGDFLKGRGFTIGKSTVIKREKGDTYGGFLIKNNMVSTDATRNDAGQLFHAPTLSLGLQIEKDKDGNDVLPFETGPKVAITRKPKKVTPKAAPAKSGISKAEYEQKKAEINKRREKELNTATVLNTKSQKKDSLNETYYQGTKEFDSFAKDNLTPQEYKKASAIINMARKNDWSLKRLQDKLSKEFNIKFSGGMFTIAYNTEANKINAKYDAEIAVLGEPTPTKKAPVKKESPATKTVKAEEIEVEVPKQTAAKEKKAEAKLKAAKGKPVPKRTDKKLKEIDKKTEDSLELTETKRAKQTDPIPGMPETDFSEIPEIGPSQAQIDALDDIDTSSFDHLSDDELPSLDDGIDAVLDLNKKKGGRTRPYKKTSFKRQNLKKELSWVNRMTNIPLSDVQLVRLGELVRNGRKNFGLFSRDGILLYEAAEEGTLYHEAFHKVSLGYLSESERKVLYRAARLYYKMPKATDKQIEEKLAEGFREYKLDRDANKDTSTLGQIKRFFSELYDFIRALFIKQTGRYLDVNDVEGLFKEVYKGRFRFSKMTEENYKKLEFDEYAKVIGGRDFHTIGTRKDAHDITKFLMDNLIETNNVVEYGDVVNLKWAPVIQLLNDIINMYDRISKSKSAKHSAANREDASRIKMMYEEVLADIEVHGDNGNRSVFVTKVNSYLNNIGIREKYSKDFDNTSDLKEDEELVGKVDFDKKMSYETSSKEKARAKIKFIVATLYESASKNPVTKTRNYVDFDSTWHLLAHHLHKYDTVEEMIDELEYLGTTLEGGYRYTQLAERLNKEKEQTRIQFLTTFRMHRHEFLTFVFKQHSVEGTNIGVTNTTLKQAYDALVKKWNQQFILDQDIIRTNEKGEKFIRQDFMNTVLADFEDISSKVEVAVIDQDHSAELAEEVKQDLVALLDSYHIYADTSTINTLLDKRGGEYEIEKLDSLLSSLRNLFVGDNFAGAAEEGRAIVSADQLFFKDPIVREIGEAHAETHPEEIPDVIKGAGGNNYFSYSSNNMLTDINRRIYKERTAYVEEKSALIGNKGSMVFSQMKQDGFNFDDFGLVTFSSLKERDSRDTGRDFTTIAPIEDYLVRFTAIEQGYLPMSILADRKQYYLMKGVKLYKDAITGIERDEEGKRTYNWSDEVIDRYYQYYLDEKDRITAATKLRDAYKAAETAEEREILEMQMIENYHYTGDFDVDSQGANAYRFIHFKNFPKKGSATTIKNKIRKILDAKLEEEINFASTIDVIYDVDGLLSHKTISKNSFIDKASDLENDGVEEAESDAIRHVFADFLVNSAVGVFEAEKVFFGDPAFFKKNKETNDVDSDMYKRWFGAGSTGMNITESTSVHPDSTYSVLTAKTQTFESKFLPALLERQTELYEEYLKTKPENKDLSEAEIKAAALKLAKGALSAYEKVDPTDGQMIIAPELYRSIADRIGEWTPEKDNAFRLLQSEKELTVEEEISALGVVLQPLKTVYIGKETRGNLDVIIYDKMSMATIFRRQVAGTHLEKLLDRMEGREYEGGPTGVLKPIGGIKFDSVTKVGGRKSIELFKDGDTRTELNDLTDVPIFDQKFENLKHQVETDVHDVELQTVGTQMFKIASMNIDKEATYGKFGTGRDITTKITESRMAVSDIGVEEVRSKFGVENNQITDANLIQLLREAADKGGKSDDFIQALKLDDNNKAYLQLDSFPDRAWVYSRLVSIINSHTIDLNMPGNQLIQVSDYGYSSNGLDKVKQFRSDLSFITLSENGKTVHEIEARVSINLFKKYIPNYENLSWAEKEAFVKNNLNIIGYRIPTQGQNSIVRLKVVELLREQDGDVVQLPLEFTALTGSDFDIDKLYVMSYNYYTDDQGKLQKYKFIEGTDEKSVNRRYFLKSNEYKRIYKGDESKVPSREEFESWSIARQNTKEANQNRMLEAFYTILGHEAHFLETTTPLGSTTGVLRTLAEDLIKAEQGGKTKGLTSLEMATPKFQTNTKFKFIGATGGIGVFALANAHHSLTQQAELGMNTALDFGWNETTLKLDRIRGEDGRLLSDWLSALIDAHVDAVKDPYIIQLNVNESTYDVLNFMLRIGAGLDSFHFLSQPILKEFAAEYFNATGNITAYSDKSSNARKAAFDHIKGRWVEKLGYELDSFSFGATVEQEGEEVAGVARTPLVESLNRKTLIHDTNTTNHNTNAFIERQLNILEHFMEIAAEADNLTQLVMRSRIDTKKFGATPTELRAFLNGIMALEASNLANTSGAVPKWVNLERLISSTGEYVEGGTMLSPLLKNSLRLTLDLLADKSIYASHGFSQAFWEILNSVPNGRVAKNRTVRDVTEELYSYYAGQFFADKVDGLGVDEKYLRKLFSGNKNTFFHTLDRIKRGAHPLSAELQDNKFISGISLEYSEDAPLHTYIRMPFRSFADKWEMDDYVDDLNDLFIHSDPRVRKLAKEILIASFYMSGFRSRLNSFHGYIPLEVIKSMDVDGKKVSFDEYIKNLLTQLNSEDVSAEHIFDAKKEVLMNNWFNADLVPRITPNAIVSSFGAANATMAYTLDSSKEGALNHSGKLYLGTNKYGDFVFSPFLLMQMEDNSTQLLEYTGLLKGNPVYRITNKKGFIVGGAVLREYGLTGQKSIADFETIAEAQAEAERLEEEGEGRTLFNSPHSIEEGTFVKAMKKKGNFKHVPFVDQVVVDYAPQQNAFTETDMRGGTTKKVRVDLRPANQEKILAGEKTTTVRTASEASKIGLMAGETGVFEIQGQLFNIKLRNSKPLGIREAGGLEKMLASEGVASVEDFAYKHTKSWAEGKRKLFIYDISRREEVAQSTTQRLGPSYYEGDITPSGNTVFVFGSNPEGRHGAGAAKVARNQFGAKYGQGEGLQGDAYALPTKDLRIKENKGFKSISPKQIIESIKTLYEVARQNPDKQFKVAYRNTTETSLNGYTGLEMIDMFKKAGEIPANIIFSKEWVDADRARTKAETVMAGDKGRVAKETTNMAVEPLSSPNKRINIFADGSVIWKDKVAETYGYGAYMTFMGSDYQLSGNKEAVDKYMAEVTPEGTTAKMSSVVVELLATLEALKAFENTGEHITIFQDGDSAVNYGRVLWERSAGSESRQTTGPKKIHQPHIQKIVSEIERLILNIEKGSGSVKIKWIPTNKGAYEQTAVKYPGTFSDDKGVPSSKLVTFYGRGNSRADALARDTKNRNTFSALGAPKVGEVRTTFTPTTEELENGENKKNQCKLPGA